MTETIVRHPGFARLYERLSAVAEAKGASEHRREALAGLAGRVVEVGAGTGHNFRHYPETVNEVIAVEPEPYLRARAEEAARNAPVDVRVVDGTADRLPAHDGEFDAAVFSLVLCSVADQRAALAEAKRVLKPGAEIRLFEHVRAEGPRMATWQRRIDAVWPYLGGGCHTSRDTMRVVNDCGFSVEAVRRFPFAPSLLTKPAAPHVIAVARLPYTPTTDS